jgi:hypothetical protein
MKRTLQGRQAHMHSQAECCPKLLWWHNSRSGWCGEWSSFQGTLRNIMIKQKDSRSNCQPVSGVSSKFCRDCRTWFHNDRRRETRVRVRDEGLGQRIPWLKRIGKIDGEKKLLASFLHWLGSVPDLAWKVQRRKEHEDQQDCTKEQLPANMRLLKSEKISQHLCLTPRKNMALRVHEETRWQKLNQRHIGKRVLVLRMVCFSTVKVGWKEDIAWKERENERETVSKNPQQIKDHTETHQVHMQVYLLWRQWLAQERGGHKNRETKTSISTYLVWFWWWQVGGTTRLVWNHSWNDLRFTMQMAPDDPVLGLPNEGLEVEDSGGDLHTTQLFFQHWLSL